MKFRYLIPKNCIRNSIYNLQILWRMLKMMKIRVVKYIFSIISMSVVISCFDMITAFLLKNIIFRARNYENEAIFTGLKEEILICVGLGLLMQLIYGISFYIYTMEAKTAEANLRIVMCSKCMRLPYATYEQTNSSEFISKMLYDCERACGIYTSRFRRIFMPLLMMSFYLISMFLLNWQVTLCLLGSSTALFIINVLSIEPIQCISKEMSCTNISITKHISNILSGMEQIRIFSLKSIMVDWYIEDNEKFRKKQQKINLISSNLDALNQLFELLGSLVFISLGLVFVNQGVTSVENLAAIYLLYGFMNWNFLQVGLHIPSMASYLTNARRVFEFLEVSEEPANYMKSTIQRKSAHYKFNARKLQNRHVSISDFANNAVCFRDVSFSYNNKQNILEHLDLEIPKGKCVALKGKSGKGKSTIAKLLLGLYPINDGEIYLNGKSLEEYSLIQIRELISYVPQEPYLFDVSIAENIRYGKPDANKRDIINAAKLANAHEFILNLEHGYDTKTGERGNLLSGGQRQRIAIARAILKNAPILILDEATSALDNESEQLINEALYNFMKGRTTIVISHRNSTLEFADLIIEI
ncbi:ABC transporter ATP-binding protein [Lachnospiraceae bacterium MD335]|nr:ABC transporter ATP-binding protein [Lachnospiraceae bacterium MD335]